MPIIVFTEVCRVEKIGKTSKFPPKGNPGGGETVAFFVVVFLKFTCIVGG